MVRNIKLDVLKGILIVFVVIGHSISNYSMKNIIFFFHMPVFYMISGFLLDGDKITSYKYIIKKSKRLLITYFSYGFLEIIILKRTIKDIFILIYGGHFVSGVYWYITCYIVAVFIFALMIKYLSKRKCILMLLVCGLIAVTESNFIYGKLGEKIISQFPEMQLLSDFLKEPGIIWNADVALLAVVYIGIGYFSKEIINSLLESDKRKYNIMTCVSSFMIMLFIGINVYIYNNYFVLDMKYVKYKSLFTAFVLPCLFGILLTRCIYYLCIIDNKAYIQKLIGYLGRNTLPIMFMHIPIKMLMRNVYMDSINNKWQCIINIIAGVLIPILISIIFKLIRRR